MASAVTRLLRHSPPLRIRVDAARILSGQPFGLAALFFVFPLGGGVFHEGVKTLPASQRKKRGAGQIERRKHMKQNPLSQSFPLGQTVITSAARDQLHPEDVYTSLQRHARRDWGDVCPADREENELSLREGFRLLSAYRDRNGTKFWIITEADRSATTVLLPEDY